MRSRLPTARPVSAKAPGRASFAGSSPSTPNSDGTNTVQPAAATRRANEATSGVIPGISAITMTAGPLPVT